MCTSDTRHSEEINTYLSFICPELLFILIVILILQGCAGVRRTAAENMPGKVTDEIC